MGFRQAEAGETAWQRARTQLGIPVGPIRGAGQNHRQADRGPLLFGHVGIDQTGVDREMDSPHTPKNSDNFLR